jgi:hypothetical protein
MTMDKVKYFLVTSEQVLTLGEITDDNTTAIVECRSESEVAAVKKTAAANGDILKDISDLSLSAPDYIDLYESVDKAVNKLLKE